MAADSLTSIRFLLGPHLLWLGLHSGPEVVPPHGLLLVTWVALVLIATWPRFAQQVLPEFLNGMRDLL